MKKQAYLFALILAFCCCGCNQNPAEPEETEAPTTHATEAPTEQATEAPTPEPTTAPDAPEETPEETQKSVSSMDIARTVYYDDVDEFLSSDFCHTMQSAGYTPYVLSYDTEKYELSHIRCDSRFYEFSLLEKENGGSIIYCVTYDAYFKNVEEIAALYVDEPEKNLITSVEKDGSVFDVHVSRIPSPDVSHYNLSYLPFEGYMVYIGSDSPTPEEAIAYIHEFDLVPAE